MISASEFQVLLISHVILHSHHFSFCSPAGKIIEDTLQFSGEHLEFETGFPHFQVISDTYIVGCWNLGICWDDIKQY